jgi:hypothetical protein
MHINQPAVQIRVFSSKLDPKGKGPAVVFFKKNLSFSYRKFFVTLLRPGQLAPRDPEFL